MTELDLVAPLVALAKAGIPTDVQELLVQGDAMRGIAPGALAKALASAAPPAPVKGVDDLAQEIRRVDGGNSLGAGALAEALMPFLARSALTPAAEPVALHKRPTAFMYESAPGELLLTTNEDFARTLADAHGGDYRGLYLRASPAPSPAVEAREDGALWVSRIAEVMDEGDGFWRACSGCHELNDGAPTGAYSAAFKTHVGLGCGECGGLGAVWDTTNYQEMAQSMMTEDAPAVTPDAVREVAETYRKAMLMTETMLNSLPVPVSTDGATSQVWKRISEAADNLRKARHDVIFKYGSNYDAALAPQTGWMAETLADALAHGIGFARVNPDGTVERLNPADVKIGPASPEHGEG